MKTNGNDNGQLLIMASSDEKASANQGLHLSTGLVHNLLASTEGENEELQASDEIEKEERRKIATKVFEKQG